MKKRWMAVLLLLVLLLGIGNGKAIYATSASVAFSSSSKTYQIGDQFVVTLTASASVGISDFQTYVAYDPSILELVDTGNYVAGNDGLVFISDLGNSKKSTRKYRMKFKALKEGPCEIYVSDDVYIYEADTGEEMSVSKNILQLDITKPVMTIDSHKGLSSLTVSEGNLIPEFSSEITEYQVVVSADTEMLYMDAKGALESYQVKVNGNTQLKTGENTATIEVTDLNGQSKIYTIKIYKKSKEEEALSKEEESEPLNNTKKKTLSLQVSQKKEKILFQSGIELEIVPIPEYNVVPDGYVENTFTFQGIEVPVYVPEQDSASDYVLLYGKTAEGNAQFYCFDRIQETIQRYQYKEQNVVSSDETVEKYKQKIELLYGMVFLLLVIVLIVFSIWVSGKLWKKETRELEKEYEEEYWDE